MDIFLGKDTLAWCDAGRARWETHDQSQGRLTELFAATQGKARRRFLPWPRGAARLWLSGAVARPFLVQQPLGVQRYQDRLAVAQAMAAEATGLPGPCSLQLESQRPGPQTGLVVAADATWLTQIEAAAQGAQLTLRSIRPWWAAVLQQALVKQPRLELFSLRDTDALILLLASGDDWLCADAYVPVLSQPDTDLLLQRKSLIAGAKPARTWAGSISQSDSIQATQASAGVWPQARQSLVDTPP